MQPFLVLFEVMHTHDRTQDTAKTNHAASSPPSDRQGAGSDQIARILDATLAEMVECSPKAPRIVDIAKRARMSTKTIYVFFPTKDDLLAALLARVTALSRSYLEHQMTGHTDPKDQIGAWIRTSLARLTSPEAARLARPVLLQLARSSPQRVLYGGNADYEITVRQLLHEPLRRCGSDDFERDAHVIGDLVFGMSRRFLWGEQYASTEDIEHVVECCLARFTVPTR